MNQVFSAESAMSRAILISKLGLGKTFPNPIVGAVITNSKGKLISEGFHSGNDHAEVVALKNADELPSDAILYVSLEPCNHYGKTPPCVDAIIKSGIKKVFFAVSDPNPIAKGGADRLAGAGIEVIANFKRDEAALINRAWLTKIEKGRPQFIWKIAATLDGKIAAKDGSSKWITCEEARKDVAQMRTFCDAILTSTKTVISDNPLLTSHGIGKNPIRIIIGKRELDSNFKVFNHEAETAEIKSHDFDELVKFVTEKGFNQVLIESGPTLGTNLLKANLVDEIVLYQAPTFFGSGKSLITDLGITNILERHDFTIVDFERIGTDLKTTLLNKQKIKVEAI